MTRDTLDDLLNRSAPECRSAAQSDLDAMIADARHLPPRPFRARILIAAALAAVFASGGVGIAAATDGFTWAPWAQRPIGAVHFTMTNGFQCELRFAAYTGGTDPGYVEEVNGILEDWYRESEVAADVRALVPAALKDIGPIELQEGETLDTLPPGEAENREWAREWMAWDVAVNDAEWQELKRHGLDPEDTGLAGAERNSQIQCFDNNHEPYVPGAGS